MVNTLGAQNTQQQMLDKNGVIAYVGANASKYGLDPAAVLAVADHEGLNTIPGNIWYLKGEGGAFNFGPPSWQSAGAGKNIIAAQGTNAPNWAWTPAGIDYWLQAVHDSGAAGLTGVQAITQIVGGYGWGFERPADPSADIWSATQNYKKYQSLITQATTGGPGGNIIVTPPDTPGNITIPGITQPGQLPIPNNPTSGSSPTQAQTGNKFSMQLFQTPFGPFNLTLPWDFSGILLFLAAIFAIILGAMLWKPTRERIQNTIQTGATVAAVAA